MSVIKSTNLALRFLLELCALPTIAYWGATGPRRRDRRILLSLTAPLAVGVVWMLLVAPGATTQTAPLVRFLAQLAVLAAATTGLLRRARLALADALGYALNRALMAVWHQ